MKEAMQETRQNTVKRLMPFLVTLGCLLLLGGFLLDGYILAKRFSLTMLPVTLCYVLVVMKTNMSLGLSRILGILIPAIVFGVLALI